MHPRSTSFPVGSSLATTSHVRSAQAPTLQDILGVALETTTRVRSAQAPTLQETVASFTLLLFLNAPLHAAPDYAIGADLSFLKQVEERGVKFKDGGGERNKGASGTTRPTPDTIRRPPFGAAQGIRQAGSCIRKARRRAVSLLLALLGSTAAIVSAQEPAVSAPTPSFRGPPPFGTYMRTELRARDACVYPDPATKSYVMYFASRGPNRRAAVVAYTSKDLENWTGPTFVFERPEEWWADRGIWAPEMHEYEGKYHLFLTFDSSHEFPEQWRNWRPRVKRASQILVSDSPMGPFKPFANKPTLPEDMMTLDGTLFVEDGVPYMVFCHEWVQIKDGTVDYIQLTPDLSATVGEPFRLFNGSDAPWSRKNEEYGCHVTDGPWLHRTASDKLLMLWSSFTDTGYAVGIATSESGKLAGPWKQSPTPLFANDGGHPMLFRRFDGQLMLALHSPNETPHEREQFFEVNEDCDTLVLANP